MLRVDERREVNLLISQNASEDIFVKVEAVPSAAILIVVVELCRVEGVVDVTSHVEACNVRVEVVEDSSTGGKRGSARRESASVACVSSGSSGRLHGHGKRPGLAGGKQGVVQGAKKPGVDAELDEVFDAQSSSLERFRELVKPWNEGTNEARRITLKLKSVYARCCSHTGLAVYSEYSYLVRAVRLAELPAHGVEVHVRRNDANERGAEIEELVK